MIFNKNLKRVLLVIFATLILSACSTAKKSGDIDGDVYTGTETVKYLASGVPDRVFFATNKSSLTTASRATLRKQANYLRKKVVQIGPSLFCKLPAANYVRTPQEAVELILNKKAKLRPIRASIVWFVYLTKYEFKLPAYNYIKNGLVHFNNQKISIPLLQRIKMLPPKIYSNVLKGNFDFLTNFFFYFRNFIKGENKVKW